MSHDGQPPDPLDPTLRQDPTPGPPHRIGNYRLLDRVGVGGMGEVWRAEQTAPIRRTVALKVIKAGMDSTEIIARFEAERQALALMNHPCIAKVFDAGTTVEGRPFFAMEYVPGVSITDYCDKHRLSTGDRLTLFRRVCDGVLHAHQKAVLHRDLKPGNILVADVDGMPSPKIIDFGVAKATTQKLTDKTMHTALGQLIGTPEYMSPEQAELTGEDVDTRTDVYSLGVILYELLAGALPFESSELRKAGFEGIVRIIRDQDPPRPSTRLSTLGDQTDEIAARRRTGPRRLGLELRGDLDWIVMRCLEKDRNRRYGSPLELSQDIERHQLDQPVLAGPPSARYRAGKFVRRNRVGVSVAAAAIILLTGFTVTTAIQSGRIAAERDRANQEAEAAQRVSTFLADMLGGIDAHRLGSIMVNDLRDRVAETRMRAGDGSDGIIESFDAGLEGVSSADLARDVLGEELLTRAARTIEDELGGQPLIAAGLYQTLGNTYEKLGMFPEAVQQLDRAVSLREEQLGAEHVLTLEARHDYALANVGLGTPAESMAAMTDVFEIRSRTLGPEHPQTLESMYQLGVMHHYAGGQAAAADSLHQEVLVIRRRILDEEDPALLSSMHAVADMDGHMGRYSRADSLFTLCLERQRRVLGPEHNATLACTLDMAFFYSSSLGRYLVAEELFLDLLDVRRRVLGNEHPDTVYAAGVLADLYREWGRLDLAGPFQVEAVELNRRIHGSLHNATAVALRQLGQYYCHVGRAEDSQALYEECLQIQSALYGPEHPRVLRARWNRGSMLRVAGQSEQSLQILEDVYSIRLRHTDDQTTVPIKDLVTAYSAIGRHGDAERLIRGRIEALEQISRPALDWKQDLGRVYQESERYTEASDLFEEVLTETEGDKLHQRARLRLAQTWSELGRTDESRMLFTEYIAVQMERADTAGMNIKLRSAIAWTLLEQVPAELLDIERILVMTASVNEITEYTTVSYITTHALALHLAGRSGEAVAAQRQALELLHPQDSNRAKNEERLAEFVATTK